MPGRILLHTEGMGKEEKISFREIKMCIPQKMRPSKPGE
jgi:hypothetical protein